MEGEDRRRLPVRPTLPGADSCQEESERRKRGLTMLRENKLQKQTANRPSAAQRTCPPPTGAASLRDKAQDAALWRIC